MNRYMSMEHLKFLLTEVHSLKTILEKERFVDYDEQTVLITLEAIKDWADKEFYPYYEEMDQSPAYFDNGTVKSHPQVAKVIKQAGEQGFIGRTFDIDKLGSQMPQIVALAMNHIIQAANNHLPGYIGLTSGAAALIVNFGSDKLFNQFVPEMIAGKWSGTMALTEPQAGSSLSDIECMAIPSDNGSYNIKGQKIFISGGDFTGIENIVHLTLARIEGAPKGTKGISLFVVPKFRKNEKGELISNDVITAGDFQKLGQRGYSTVHLSYGENNDCKGWLVGQENKGLNYMFQMMNGARIDVGLTACSTATAAYYASLQYAKERPQGRKLTSDGTKNLDEDQTLIINHPDVRRMLFFQKSVVEGSLSLLLFCARLEDLIQTEPEHASAYHLLLELLTPIAKTFPSEYGLQAVSNGLQVLGGYGYCMDFPLQEYYRDIRIMPIYEGTTGIQSLDLLGRKIPFNDGQAIRILYSEIEKTILSASQFSDQNLNVDQLKEAMDILSNTIADISKYAVKGNYEKYLSNATVFMEMMSLIVIAWQWLDTSTHALQIADQEEDKYSDLFLESKVKTCEYFFNYELPKIKGLSSIVTTRSSVIIKDKEILY